jgi:hypothetical protein
MRLAIPPAHEPTPMKRLLSALCLLLAATTTLPAWAQAWPSKPVKIVLQFPPGGSTDAVARILAQALQASLGQTVLVENRPGADGAIAGDFVARSEPDGHTFFLASNTPMMQVPLLKKNPPYDPVKSFTPVSLVGRYIYVLVTSPTLPAKDVNELLAYARTNPGKLGYGSYSGVTQLMHTNLKLAKAETNLVPYKGEAPTVTDILGNHVQMTFATPASTLPHIKDGKLRAMAVPACPGRTGRCGRCGSRPSSHMQRHAGGGLQAQGGEGLAVVHSGVVGVADHHARRLEAGRGHALECRAAPAARAPLAQRLLLRAHQAKAAGAGFQHHVAQLRQRVGGQVAW